MLQGSGGVPATIIFQAIIWDFAICHAIKPALIAISQCHMSIHPHMHFVTSLCELPVRTTSGSCSAWPKESAAGNYINPFANLMSAEAGRQGTLCRMKQPGNNSTNQYSHSGCSVLYQKCFSSSTLLCP